MGQVFQLLLNITRNHSERHFESLFSLFFLDFRILVGVFSTPVPAPGLDTEPLRDPGTGVEPREPGTGVPGLEGRGVAGLDPLGVAGLEPTAASSAALRRANAARSCSRSLLY